MKIDTSQLDYGQDYTVQLVLTNTIKEICKFYYNFTVNYPPSGYSLNVDPNTGIENSQIFTMTVINPISINNYYPLKYSFGYYLNAEKVYLCSDNSNPKFSFVLGFIQQQVSLFALIFDSLGDVTELNSVLTLQIDPLFDPSAYLNQEIESSSVLYPQISLKIVNIINSVILRDYNQSSSTSLELLNQAFAYSLSLINSYINSSISSSNIVDNVLSMLNQMTSNPNLISNTNTIMTTQALSLLFALNSNLGISSAQGEKLLIIANNSLVLNRVSLYNNTNGINSVIHILDDTFNAMLKQLTPNTKIVIGTGTIEATITTFSLNQSSEFALTSNSNPKASVSFPSNFKIPSLPSDRKIVLTFTLFDPVPAAEYSTPTIIAINLYALTDSIKIDISNLSVPINISIPIYNLNSNNLKCYYLDQNTQRWTTTGCSVGEIGPDYAVCMCSHLSSFTAGNSLEHTLLPDSNIDDTFNVNAFVNINATNAIGAYFCFVILVLYIASAIVLEAKDRKFIKNLLLQNSSESQTQMTKEIRVLYSNSSMENQVLIENLENQIIIELDKNQVSIENEKNNNFIENEENKNFIENEKNQISKENEEKQIFIQNEENFIENDENKLSTKNQKNQGFTESLDKLNYSANKSSLNTGSPKENLFESIKENKDSNEFLTERNNQKIELEEDGQTNSMKNQFIKLHPILSIFYVYDEERPRIVRITLEFINTIGNMYFIGLFYKGTKAVGTNFSEVIAGYTIEDFVIIIYSNLIMISFITISRFVSKTKAIDFKQPTNVVLALIKKNNLKKLVGLVLGWTSLGYCI